MKEELNKHFKAGANTDKMLQTKEEFLSGLKSITPFVPKIQIQAPLDLISTTNVDEKYIYLFLTNVRGLTTVYDTEVKKIHDVKISFTDSFGTDEVYMLPFLGSKEKIKTQVIANEISLTIPEIDKGMVIMIKRI
jgi:hypothetical protein